MFEYNSTLPIFYQWICTKCNARIRVSKLDQNSPFKYMKNGNVNLLAMPGENESGHLPGMEMQNLQYKV